MIREVQLTNFMSYKNASVPLEPGLNLIVGPNGAGKSSILLAISVVLGQAYTERSRKLSELIRWGEQEARISLKLDNTSLNGPKPFPQARTEEVLLTRVLKRNGDYLYLLNNKPISKTGLAESLSRIGLNPDNMLVIMHQLMVGRFGSVSPTEKLLLLEDAIGFRDYRRDVQDASTRLQKLTTERETMSSVLEGTKETYLHWQREYEKFELKRKLEGQLGDLQRELVWRRIIRKEFSLSRLKERIGSLESEADTAKKDFADSETESRKVAEEIVSLTGELERFREEQLKLEHGRGFRTAASQWMDQVNQIVRTQEKLLVSLEGSGASAENTVVREGRELKKALSDFLEEQERISRTAEKENQQSQQVRAEIARMSGMLAKATELLIESRVLLGVSKFKLSLTTQQLEDLELQLRLGNEELEPLVAQAAKLGSRFESPRDLQVISLDLAGVQEKLRPLAHLSEEVEKMYKTYGDMYQEMKKKAEAVEHNRTEVLGELRERFDRWQVVMGKMFEDLSERYSALLSEVGAKGRIVLKASKDIEKAGLELYAGFKGNEPVSLDSLAPSGGERTISLIAFLLSLQQYVSSPFRAIDEFDVHMDPRNRETVSRLIYAAAKTSGSRQYIAITPGQVSLPGEESVHVVVVQSVEGSSVVKELK